MGWNLLLAAIFLDSTLARAAVRFPLSPQLPSINNPLRWVTPAYLVIFFIGYAAANLPIDLWFGYLEERHFCLATARCALGTRLAPGPLAAGCHVCEWDLAAIVLLQTLMPTLWFPAAAALLAITWFLTAFLMADLVPVGLVQFELPAEPAACSARLKSLIGGRAISPIVIFQPPRSAVNSPAVSAPASGAAKCF